MYQDKGFKTIFDDVKAKKIEKASIPEDEIVKPKSLFHINDDKFDSFIVDEYKMPTFKFIHDDSLNDFYDFPDISLSDNPIYKHKYPKLSTDEYIKEQLQTENGTPNELNRFMRQDQLKFSIEDIKQSDDAYQAGLNEIQKIINEDYENIKNAYNKATDVTKKQQIQKIHEKRASEYKDLNEDIKKFNPVIINKVLETKKDKIITEDDARKAARNLVKEHWKDDPDTKLLKQLSTPKAKLTARIYKNLLAAKPTPPPPPPVAKPVAEPVAQSKTATKSAPTSPAAKPKSKLTLVSTTPVTKIRKGEVVNETKSSEPMKSIDKEKELNEKANKIKSLIVKGTSKGRLEKKRESIDKSDEKTEMADTNPQTETYKINLNSFKALMKTYKDLPDAATIENLSSEDQVKMKGYIKA